jgi:DNA replication protein DnaC
MSGYKVASHNLCNKLSVKLMMAKFDSLYKKELAKIENCDLLIFDDLSLQAMNNYK